MCVELVASNLEFDDKLHRPDNSHGVDSFSKPWNVEFEVDYAGTREMLKGLFQDRDLFLPSVCLRGFNGMNGVPGQ